MRHYSFFLMVLTAMVSTLWMPGPVDAEVIAVKDSADFDWKYEFTTVGDLPDDIDIDGRIGGDFRQGSSAGTTTAPGGYLRIATASAGSQEDWVSDNAANGQVWPDRFTYANGCTAEARIKVVSGLEGVTYATEFGGSPGGNGAHFMLLIGAGGQGWYGGDALGTNDNTDDYHVFRVAQEAGSATYSVWRDGILLSDSLGASLTYSADRLFFGDGDKIIGGTADFDYVRFTSGAFAPVPEPSTLVLLGLGAVTLACAVLRRRWRR